MSEAMVRNSIEQVLAGTRLRDAHSILPLEYGDRLYAIRFDRDLTDADLRQVYPPLEIITKEARQLVALVPAGWLQETPTFWKEELPMTTQWLNLSSELALPVESVIGESIADLGIKGSGKSTTAAVLAEELMGVGIPICIIDVADEYYGLKEKYNIVVCGCSEHADLPLGVGQAAALAEFSIRQSVSIIISLAGYTVGERFALVQEVLETLWNEAGRLRRPYQLIIEECHNFLPQGKPAPTKDIATLIATEGRKRGLGVVLVGQRSSRIEKDVLTQAGISILHRVHHPADLSVYKDILPAETRWIKETNAKLRRGQAFVYHLNDETDSNKPVQVVQIRNRHTFHAGYTPGMGDVVAPEFLSINADLLAALRETMLRAASPEQVERHDAHVEETLQKIREQEDINLKLKADIDEERQGFKRRIGELEDQLQRARQRIGVLEAEMVELRTAAVAPVEVGADEVQPVPVTTVAQAPTPIPVMVAAAKDDDTVISERARRRQVTQEEREFSALLTTLDGLPAFHRRTLRYLIKREPYTFSINELARGLALSSSTITKNPPTWLLNEGLIHRAGGSAKSYRHSSRVDVYFKKKFPTLDADRLRERLVNHLPV